VGQVENSFGGQHCLGVTPEGDRQTIGSLQYKKSAKIQLQELLFCYLRGVDQSGEFAERNDEIVKVIAHAVVGRNHSTLPEARNGFLVDGGVVALVEDETQSSHSGAPNQREQIVIEKPIGGVNVDAFLAGASPQQHLP